MRFDCEPRLDYPRRYHLREREERSGRRRAAEREWAMDAAPALKRKGEEAPEAWLLGGVPVPATKIRRLVRT